MLQRVHVYIERGDGGLVGALVRYDVLERVATSAARLGVVVLAFGFGRDELRWVVEGRRDDVLRLMRLMKGGTTRAAKGWGFVVEWSPTFCREIEEVELEEAVVWAHGAPIEGGASGALASPWSSHRDLMGFRVAPFYDHGALWGRVDPARVHAAIGGRPLPDGWPPPPDERESLPALLRVAAAMCGVMPADRRCFRLFVHLARARGWSTVHLAGALALTKRRVRQLANDEEPMLERALIALGDPRLRIVP